MHYTSQELKKIGVKFGENVLISSSVNFYNINLEIGNNVRIDDYCILKGNILLGNNVHIGAFSILAGGGASIKIGNRVGISSRASIFTATEDFNSDLRGNPTLPQSVRSVISGPIEIEDDVIIGSGVTILPNVKINKGVSMGANILLSKNIPEKFRVVSYSRLIKL